MSSFAEIFYFNLYTTELLNYNTYNLFDVFFTYEYQTFDCYLPTVTCKVYCYTAQISRRIMGNVSLFWPFIIACPDTVGLLQMVLKPNAKCVQSPHSSYL